MRDGRTHSHRPRLVVSHSTCPPLSSPPHANSFVIGPAVIKHTHRGAVDRFGIPNPRESGSVIGADLQRSGPSCVLLKRVPQGQTEIGGIVLAAVARGATSAQRRCHPERRCTYRPSVIYLIVNKSLSLSLSLSKEFKTLTVPFPPSLSRSHFFLDQRWPLAP